MEHWDKMVKERFSCHEHRCGKIFLNLKIVFWNKILHVFKCKNKISDHKFLNSEFNSYIAGIYLFKVNNGNTKAMTN